MIEPKKINKVAEKYADKNVKFRLFLKERASPDELDKQFRDFHNEIFIGDEYDCCKCNNCCKSYDIRVEKKDISAISEYLEQSENDFIKMYLAEEKVKCLMRI